MKRGLKVFVSIVLIALMAFIGLLVLPRLFSRAEGKLEQNNFNKMAGDIREAVSVDDEEIIKELNIDLIDGFVEKYNNEEIVGFIDVDGTNISYPIVHTDNNVFYLNHGYDKKYDVNGVIFLDADNESLGDMHTVLYGHRIASGTMFNHLTKFLKKDFAKDKNIYIYTREGVRTYRVFSVFRDYAYTDYRRLDFASEEEFKDYIQVTKNRSEFNLDVDEYSVNKIITLSTCSYEGDNYRLVVCGYLFEE